ncbi:MAG: hypothetical protein JWO20_2202 [Candidatus Angelobacter sp.]|jgi:hypothetical protein|nr:hypothetical protein [Candidatus Angelobacter sp.]
MVSSLSLGLSFIIHDFFSHKLGHVAVVPERKCRVYSSKAVLPAFPTGANQSHLNLAG